MAENKPANPDDSGNPAIPPAVDPPANPPADPPAADPPADPPATIEYTDFELPEGMTANADLLEKAIPIFKEIGLTQEQAQRLVALQAEAALAQQDAVIEQVQSWEASVKADKEIGGDKFEENLGLAKLGLAKIGTPELQQFLTETGAGSHPEVVRAFVRLGRLLKEDNPGGGEPSAAKKDIVELLYPKKNLNR